MDTQNKDLATIYNAPNDKWETAFPTLSMAISYRQVALIAGTMLWVLAFMLELFAWKSYEIMGIYLLVGIPLIFFSVWSQQKSRKRVREGTTFRWNEIQLEWNSARNGQASVRWDQVQRVNARAHRMWLVSGDVVDLRHFASTSLKEHGISLRLAGSASVPRHIKEAFAASQRRDRLNWKEAAVVIFIFGLYAATFPLVAYEIIPNHDHAVAIATGLTMIIGVLMHIVGNGPDGWCSVPVKGEGASQ